MKQATTSPTRDRKIGYQSQHWQWKLNVELPKSSARSSLSLSLDSLADFSAVSDHRAEGTEVT